ncbi:hypothetical protein AKO1_009055 [Acrasis kona]|uniref:PPM-type phosphatase domain-containing protein n=1 Tax=Acrasis kona TaxID=1008807 RepID=A0AAW2ZIE6_9EUKA
MFVLDLCYNQIKNLPASFHTLNQLVSLDITRNQLTQFVNMDGWTKITDLFLSSNQLQNLDLFHISESCHRLARLSAGYNKIQSDHQKWSPNSKLQQLYLSGNVIKSMSFDNLQNLTVLFLSENELESIPQHLDQLLPMIRHLDFSCNKLTNVDALQQCTNERILSVNFCLNQVQDAHHYKPNHLLTEVTSHQISHKDPNQLAPHQSLYNTKVNSKWAFAHSIGPFRTSMEDSMVINNDITINDNLHLQLYAVFDGHAGENTAKFAAERLQPVVVNIFENKYAQLQTIDAQCAEQALCEALETIDKQSEQFSDGCTAVVVMIVNKNTCVAVNIGDARAVLGNVDGSVMRLTHDHKPSDPSERNRVLELGGVIMGGRINGYAVSRAIGDHFCRPFISSKPHTCLVDLNYGVHDLLVIACDGVWDVHSDLHAVEVVNQCLRENRSGDEQRDLFRAAQRLMGSSICDRSTDNISVILVKLDH